MKSLLSKLSTAVVASALLLGTSCKKKDTVDSLSAELVTKVEELSSTIGTVHDKESAEKAAERIDEIGDEYVSVARRLDALGEPSDEDKKLVSERVGQALRAMNDKRDESLKLAKADLEAAMILGKAIVGFGSKMKEVEGTIKKFSP